MAPAPSILLYINYLLFCIIIILILFVNSLILFLVSVMPPGFTNLIKMMMMIMF